MTVQMEMPRYVSHKIVRALEIKEIGPDENENIVLVPADEGFAPLTFSPMSDLFARYKPVAGDFYVVYADGYQSFSPRKAFVDGHLKLSR